MRKLEKIKSLFCPSPVLLHFKFEGGDMLFLSFFTSLILFLLIFLLLFIFRFIYLSLNKSDEERESTATFAFYKTNAVMSKLAVIGVALVILSLFFGVLDSGGSMDGSGNGLMDFLDSIGLCSLGFAPYYLILLTIYGILRAVARFRKNKVGNFQQ